MASNTYADGSLKESVLNLISVINPDETQLLYGLQRTRASQPLHSWLKQDLAALNTSNAEIEGSEAGNDTTTDPTRLSNYTQIFRRIWKVTDTQKASAHYAKDALPRAKDEAMRLLANDMEFALMRGTTAVAGDATTTARRAKGIKSWITTNVSAGAGASFTETIFNNLLELPYNQGGKVDEVYVNGTIKRRIDGFSGGTGTSRNIDANDKRLINTVNIYESSFGVVKIFLHRYVTYSGDTNNDIVGIDRKRWGIAVLRDPENTNLPKGGSYEKGMYEGELTLEARNEKSSFKATNYV